MNRKCKANLITLLLVGALVIPFTSYGVDGQIKLTQPVAPDTFPIVINKAGSYVLTSNLVVTDPATNAITIEVNDVTLDLKGHTIQGPNASGIVRVVFSMLVDGSARGEARASVRGRVLGPALQAATTLSQGQVLLPADLVLKETDLTRLTEPPLRNPAQATGRVPVRTLGRGRIMTGSLLAAAPVVFRGDAIDLRFAREGLNIVISAIAKRDAAPGEIVPFENIASGVTLQGRVFPDGTAELVRR